MTAGAVPTSLRFFEVDNAKKMTREEVVATFVDTTAYWRVLTSKNHVILGARGSGKTVIAKMLSHDHLARYAHPKAREIVQSKALIGTYLATSLEWVGGLRNKPWQSEADAEEFFQWRLNIASCLAFLRTVTSCLDTYSANIGRAVQDEAAICAQIAEDWGLREPGPLTIHRLRRRLERLEQAKEEQLVRTRAMGRLRYDEEPAGPFFSISLFSPLRRLISIASDVLAIPEEATWLLCLDEAEYLSEPQLRILNTHLRAGASRVTFKITMTPYHHSTLETNVGTTLDVGHDFEYVYVDREPIVSIEAREPGMAFANKMLTRRLANSSLQDVNFETLFGESILLDAIDVDWQRDQEPRRLLFKYADAATTRRARKLLRYQPRAFLDSIARKVHGALLLRDAMEQLKGRGELDIYSGASMVLRCSDGNPRRLVRILGAFLNEVHLEAKNGRVREIPKKTQTRVLLAFSAATLQRIQSESDYGPELHSFISAIGEAMHDMLHSVPLSTDQYSSFKIDGKVSDDLWTLIKRAVGLGLLYPNVGKANPDEMPIKQGTFHLAFVLAPTFKILPRRGRARRLTWILQYAKARPATRRMLIEGQQALFDNANAPDDFTR